MLLKYDIVAMLPAEPPRLGAHDVQLPLRQVRPGPQLWFSVLRLQPWLSVRAPPPHEPPLHTGSLQLRVCVAA